ncbi:MAG: alpha/beta hydrolase, partial [Actinobacteria bacterium]|nr:alpha/beta hydrolase [Actinomycetota bacterium]
MTPDAAGSFEFKVPASSSSAHIRAWYQAPKDNLEHAPVLFVMTGRQRNAEEYRDEWRRLAREHGVLVVVPELSQELYPGRAYNVGVVDPSNDAVSASDWAFAVIEPLFDAVVADVGSAERSYYLYGHSAGAQFVHRFVIFQPRPRVAKAVAANAGWYTALDERTDFPYGLHDSPATAESIRAALGTPLTVLLGEDDDDPDADGLRRTSEAMDQGAHRLARGKFFFRSARAAAERQGVPFGWRLLIVPDAGHNNSEMAEAAAALLF